MKKLICFLLLITVLYGCGNQASTPTEPTVPSTTYMDEDIYTPALEAIMAQSNLGMYVKARKTMQVHGHTFSVTENKEIHYTPTAAQITATVDYGEHMLTVSEVCIEDIVFKTIDQTMFQSPMALVDYMSAQIPVDILHSDLYASVMKTQAEGEIQLTFSEPTTFEAWAMPQGGKFLHAQGNAKLNINGELISSEYVIGYVLGEAEITYEISVEYLPFAGQISKPQGEFIAIDYLQGPMLAEQAYGYLLQTANADSAFTKEVYSQANSIKYVNSTTVHRAPGNYTVSATTTLTDPSLGMEGQQQIQIEDFAEGVYSITLNGEPQEPRPGIDEQIMGRYCLDLLVSNMVSSRHFTNAVAEELDGKLVITYAGAESLAEILCRDGCRILYRDENFLDSKTDHFEDYEVTVRLVLDPVTQLPEECNITFYGIHHVGGINYTLESQYSQTFTY